ncbi:BBE domain-containing protein, partial [Nocardioides sp. AN3]
GGGARLIEVIPLRGTLGRAPRFPSALRERAEEPTWSLIPGCWWEDPSEDAQHEHWVQDVVANIQRIGPAPDRRDPSTVGVRLDPDAVARMYGERFDRLREIKRRWDPENLFVGTHGIPP